MKLTHTKALADDIQIVSLCPLMNLLAVATKSTATVFRTTTAVSLWSVNDKGGVITSIAWSPTGKLICLATSSGSLYVVYVETGEILRLFGKPSNVVQGMKPYPLPEGFSSVWRCQWFQQKIATPKLPSDTECLPVGDSSSTTLVALSREEWMTNLASVLVVFNEAGDVGMAPGGIQFTWKGKLLGPDGTMANNLLKEMELLCTATAPLALTTFSDGHGTNNNVPQVVNLSSVADHIATADMASWCFMKEQLQLGISSLEAAAEEWCKTVKEALNATHLLDRPDVAEQITQSLAAGITCPVVKNVTASNEALAKSYYSKLDLATVAGTSDKLVAASRVVSNLLIDSSMRALDWAFATATKVGNWKAAKYVGKIQKAASELLSRVFMEGDRLTVLVRHCYERVAMTATPEQLQMVAPQNEAKPLPAQHNAVLEEFLFSDVFTGLPRPSKYLCYDLLDAIDRACEIPEAAVTISSAALPAPEELELFIPAALPPLPSMLESPSSSLHLSDDKSLSLSVLYEPSAAPGQRKIAVLDAANDALPTSFTKLVGDVVLDTSNSDNCSADPSAKYLALRTLNTLDSEMAVVMVKDQLSLLQIERDTGSIPEADEDGAGAGEVKLEALGQCPGAGDEERTRAALRLSVNGQKGTCVVSLGNRFSIIDLWD